MGNSNGGYPRNGDSFWPVTGPSAHRHRYGLTQVPTLSLRSIKTTVRGGTKVTGGTWNCPRVYFYSLGSMYIKVYSFII